MLKIIINWILKIFQKKDTKIPIGIIEEIEVEHIEEIEDMEEQIYKDELTLKRIETAHPILREELLEIYDEICIRLNGRVVVRFAQVTRTDEEQNELYAQGRTKPGKIITYAKAGESNHNYGLAVDIVILIDKDGNGTYESASWNTKSDNDFDGKIDWQEIVHVFEMYGWKWGFINSKGKRWDLPHFQKTFGFSISQLKLMTKDENGYVYFP